MKNALLLLIPKVKNKRQFWLYTLFVFCIGVALAIPQFSLAHPGRTASDGCHYCRTNCDNWGVAWNERHCHRSKGLSQPSEPIRSHRGEPTGYTTPAPDYKTPTPKYVQPEPIVNQAKPEPGYEPPTKEIEQAQVSKVVDQTTPIQEKRRGFWGWLFSLFR